MNMHEKQMEMRRHCLEVLPTQLSNHDPYAAPRWHESGFYIPPGPWDVGSHKKLTPQLTQDAATSGLRIDQIGRPIHPWYEGLLAVAGVVSGTGKYWNWGPNYTVDPVVITNEHDPKVLLVQRSDNHAWAFPGGFVDQGEDTDAACRREVAEETALVLNTPSVATIYEGIVADARTTAHAWAYTTAKLWRPSTASDIVGGDDALEAHWFYIDDLPKNMHGSHAKILSFALQEL